MLQALAAIPAIISAVSKVTDLFKKAKTVKERVSGSPSVASTSEELQEEIEQLPEDQKNRWAEAMAHEVEVYAKQNERLAIDIGLVDANITSKLSQDKADRIAYLRMTTRPWTVRWMVAYILFPFFLVCIDVVQGLLKSWLFFWTARLQPFNTFAYVFGGVNPERLRQISSAMTNTRAAEGQSVAQPGVLDNIVSLFSGDTPLTLAGTMYIDSIPWVVGIIVSYMGLREFGKWKQTSGDPATGPSPSSSATSTATVIGQALKTGVDLVSRVRTAFHKRR